nr:uncharacterized protein LOC111514323 [Leptinotarsa decemlineata]
MNRCLDNFFINFDDAITTVVELGVSDHRGQLLQLTEDIHKAVPSSINRTKNYSENNIQQMLHYLINEKWENVFESSTADEKYSAFISTFGYFHNICFTSKNARPSIRSTSHWLTPEIHDAKNRLMFLHSWQKQHPTSENSKIYNDYKKNYYKLLDSTKRTLNNKRIMESDNKQKTVWSIVNKEIGRNSKHVKPVNLSEDDLNTFFVTNAESIVQKLEKINIQPETLIKLPPLQNSLFFKPVTPSDIKSVIVNFKNKKSEDLDGFNMFIVKICTPFLTEPLADVINACLTEGVFPEGMKKGKVCPLHKKGDPSLPSNFRQIVIFPVFSKILERVVYNSLISFLNLNNILSPYQYGFRKGLSTTDALKSLTVLRRINTVWESSLTYQLHLTV